MELVWMVTCEVLVSPGDLASGRTKAFVNLTTWAGSPEGAEQKISRYLESFGWHVIGIEDSHPVDERRIYEEEVAEMIEKTKNDPAAIILGRFFSYKAD
jgi:hypothetical protein